VADLLLTDWQQSVKRFRAIVPRDFRRVLEASERARRGQSG
jgi:glutamate synthase domain-containing protein 3